MTCDVRHIGMEAAMKNRILSFIFISLMFGAAEAGAQSTGLFDLTAYRSFLSSHANMSGADLLSLHPAGRFLASIGDGTGSLWYLDSIQKKYSLTSYEVTALKNKGFVVTERLRYESFGSAMLDIYHKDLPVFVTSDALLHALHNSYDAILMNIERNVLATKTRELLQSLHAQLPVLKTKYDTNPQMLPMLKDLDIYLTVPLRLFGVNEACSFADQESVVTILLDKISKAQADMYPLFSTTSRWIDFSQFTPRGHYTLFADLTKYFVAMMWIGKMEFYLIAPQNVIPKQTDEDIQRQVVDALLLSEAVDGAGALTLVNNIDQAIALFAGEADNVTLPQLRSVRQSVTSGDALALLSSAVFKAFQDSLKTRSFAFQRINSQILMSVATDPDKIQPSSSFLLLGQRFVIDSYVAGNVVYDNILYNGSRIWRPLPSTLDILFAIGNDAAAQLLASELDKYHYATNLASLRYLVDGYDTTFWNGNLYHAWLNIIRTLNPPKERMPLPQTMQTAAWWQEKMNTQLASWSQLRHDNLLYAKQSYTGGTTCSYAESYVEPIPEFYDALKAFGRIGAERLTQLQSQLPGAGASAIPYFETLSAYSDTLGIIARKELSKVPLSEGEKRFLRTMVYDEHMCGMIADGWYYRLYYKGAAGFIDKDWTVADVHTCPTDDAGNVVGWVQHAGTGAINMGFFLMEAPDGSLHSYAGPVMSYYEYVSKDFKRLTDEEWKASYAYQTTLRPVWANLYLADSTGNSTGAGPSLITGVELQKNPLAAATAFQLGSNYPNPFNASTVIRFQLPAASDMIDLTIFDINGKKVRTLLHETMPPGNFAVRWDGTDTQGKEVASGIYFYRLHAGSDMLSGKMTFLK